MISIRATRLTLASLALAACLVGPVAAQQTKISHAQGEASFASVPQKIFVYDIASLDTLHALGVEVAGVPSANFPEHLAQYAGEQYLKIGSLFEPDYELVNAEQPDLIVVAGRSAAVYPQLSAIAPTIDLSVDWTNFVGSIKERSETLGEIFGKQDEVEARIAAIDADVAAVQEAAKTAGDALILMTVGGGDMSAFGPGSRFGWLHDELGLVPAAKDVATEGSHGQTVSFEYLLETDPDWLLVIDRDAAVPNGTGGSAQAVLDNELVAQTQAAQNDHIVMLDPIGFYIVNGGLQTLQNMIDQVGAAIGADLD